jgi:hypothetical protein
MANNSITLAPQTSTVARKICPECKEEVMNVAYCRRYDPEKKKPVAVKIGYYCFGCGYFIAEGD